MIDYGRTTVGTEQATEAACVSASLISSTVIRSSRDVRASP